MLGVVFIMDELKKKALDCVEDLNNDISERGGLEYYMPFEFQSIGWQGSLVKFMGVVIWTEENDERDDISEDEKQPLRDFFIREANSILKDLNLKMGAF